MIYLAFFNNLLLKASKIRVKMRGSKKTIALVGLMGAGKTTVAAKLAQLVGLPFTDVDHEIEQTSSCTIKEIFEEYGEKEFRRRERETTLRLLSGEAKVLATGGGSFLQEEIRSALKKNCISIWLNANIETILERTRQDDRRPLLNEGNRVERLRQLMEVRYPVYAGADITVATDGQTPQDVALRIKSEIDRLEP